MFEIEFISLLNEYKKSDEYGRKKAEESISKLIASNIEKFEDFMSKNSQNFDQETISFLKQCYEKSQQNDEEEDSSKVVGNISDMDIIKRYYDKWFTEYKKNNGILNEVNEKIVMEIINFYALNRFYVLEQLFKVHDTEEFEKFKNMIKNYARRYFAEKIEQYYESDSYKNLGIFEKRRKKKAIVEILNEIGEYRFNVKKITEELA